MPSKLKYPAQIGRVAQQSLVDKKLNGVSWEGKPQQNQAVLRTLYIQWTIVCVYCIYTVQCAYTVYTTNKKVHTI